MEKATLNPLLSAIRMMLIEILGKIDSRNSNATEEELIGLVGAMKQFLDKDTYVTKEQACKYIKKRRATFDNLVAAGKIPRGEKVYPGINNLFWKVKDLQTYLDKEHKERLLK